jgi:hypothetical protein
VLDVAAESRFTRRLDIVTDAPSLLVPATDNPGRFLRLSDTAVILRNDTGDETRFDAQGLEADSLTTSKLAIDGGEVTENPMVRLVTATVGSAGSPVTLADPDCPAGWSETIEVAAIQPPSTHTHLVGDPPIALQYDRVLSVAANPWSGSRTPDVTVTYGRAVIRPPASDDLLSCLGESLSFSQESVSENRALLTARTTWTCSYENTENTDFEFDTLDVSNPGLTKVSAIIGCTPN